jgi:hypothetical protein
MAPLVEAQNAFSPGGPEYSMLGGPVGDQTAPHISVTPSGGWLVWQDNTADTSGLGIKIQKLNSIFNRSGSAQRANYVVGGDQEKPQVASMTNGGAVIVWQGGPQGFQDIYVRFIRSNFTFVATEVRANTYTNDFQINPAVTVLSDGSAVVVWASYGQDGSHQGIYGQRFAAAGTRIGSEFKVSQTSANNQRSPAIASLTGGGFVVAWVSEMQRSSQSVDVYGRIFSAAGDPAGDEFLVSGESFQPRANPCVVGIPSGGFAAAWSHKDAVPIASTVVAASSVQSSLSWDVAFARFDSSGGLVTPPRLMNTVVVGDQFAPKLSCFGKSVLATWLSLGQDGSGEGVFGQFMGEDGNPTGVEFRVNTSIGGRQIDPIIASDGANRFVVAWASYGTSRSFDLFGRIYDLIRVELTANGSSGRLKWNTQPGSTYQVQSSGDSAHWSNLGAPRIATGLSDEADVAFGSSVSVYRVVRTK